MQHKAEETLVPIFRELRTPGDRNVGHLGPEKKMDRDLCVGLWMFPFKRGILSLAEFHVSQASLGVARQPEMTLNS